MKSACSRVHLHAQNVYARIVRLRVSSPRLCARPRETENERRLSILFTYRLRRPYSLSIAAAPVGYVCVPVCSGHRGNPPFLKSHLRMCVRVPAGCACLVFPRGCPPPPPPALLRPPCRRRRCRPRRRPPVTLLLFLFLAPPFSPTVLVSLPRLFPIFSFHPSSLPPRSSNIPFCVLCPPLSISLYFSARRERETCVRERGI